MFFLPQLTPLSRPGPVVPPTLEGLGNSAIQAGSTWLRVLSTVTANSATPEWSLDNGPVGMTLTDNGDDTATLSWATDADDVSATPYHVVVSVSDGVSITSGTIDLTVVAGSAVLSVQELAMPESVNLTTLGFDDWVYYGPGFDSSNVNATARKADVDPELIGAPTFLVDALWGYGSNAGRAPFAWTDGDPEAVDEIADMRGSWIRRAGGTADKGISIPVTADDAAVNAAYVYLGTLSASASPTAGKLTLTCPGSPSVVLDVPDSVIGYVDRLFKVTYRSSIAGDLVIKWENTLTTGGLTLRAIGVAASGLPEITSSETVPFEVNVHELLTSDIEYTGSTAVALAIDLLPNGATFLDNGDNTGALAYRPPLGANTSTPTATTFEAKDGDEVLAFKTATYSVSEKTADPPVITAPTWTVVVGELNSTTITATGDTSTGAITLSSSNLPSTATLTPAGVLEWSAAVAGDIGTYEITVVATDAKGRQSEATFTANVLSASGGVLTQDSTAEYDAIANQQVVNMTSAGTHAWAHVTKDDALPPALVVDRKIDADIDVETFPEGETTVWARSFKPEIWPSSWTGGEPNPSKSSYIRALATSEADATIRFHPLIGTTQRTVTLYFGYDSAACIVRARMSDDSAVLPEVTFNSDLAADKQRKIVYTAKGTTADARLWLRIIKVGSTGSVYVTGITVA